MAVCKDAVRRVTTKANVAPGCLSRQYIVQRCMGPVVSFRRNLSIRPFCYENMSLVVARKGMTGKNFH